MAYKAFEEILDLQLFYQVQDMLFRIVEIAPKDIRSKLLFGQKKPEKRIEDQYSLCYPGEVLERYMEKCGEGELVLRAVSLAFADQKDILTSDMFIGSQRETFLRKLRNFIGVDLYVSGALYLLSDNDRERENVKKAMIGYNFSSTQEVLYALAVFQNEPSTCEVLYAVTSKFLGKNRTISVYENESIFVWFVDTFEKQIVASRKRDAGIFKSLRDLIFHHVKADTRSNLRLHENGYSDQEIVYLNMTMPPISKSYNHLTVNSIVMERVVAAGCQCILNAEFVENVYLLELCLKMMRSYLDFPVKLEGYVGLKELLSCKISMSSVDTFCFLYYHRSEVHLPNEWFLIDLLADCRWDELANRFQLVEYRKLFTECLLEKGQDNLTLWLDHYEKLTGERYENIFWTENDYLVKMTFSELVRQGACDIVQLFRQYMSDKTTFADYQKKWTIMLHHMQEVGRALNNHEIFRLWEEIDSECGILHLDEFMGREGLLELAVNNGYTLDVQHYGRRSSFWKGLDFLSKEESVKLFSWTEEYLYKRKPYRYNEFLCKFLEKKAQDLLSASEGRALFDAVIDTLALNNRDADNLRKCFYDQQEWKNYQEKKEEEKHKQENEERRIKIEKWQKAMNNAFASVSMESQKCDVLYNILKELKYEDRTFKRECIEILLPRLQTSKICAEITAMVTLIRELSLLLENNLLDWSSFTQIIMNMEVRDSESSIN